MAVGDGTGLEFFASRGLIKYELTLSCKFLSSNSITICALSVPLIPLLGNNILLDITDCFEVQALA
jgi:hypothetical protein